MADIHCTFICTAANADAARAAAAAVPGGAGMLEVGLSATGEAPATHYISSGYVRPAIRDALITHCTITEGPHDVQDVLATAGLALVA